MHEIIIVTIPQTERTETHTEYNLAVQYKSTAPVRNYAWNKRFRYKDLYILHNDLQTKASIPDGLFPSKFILNKFDPAVVETRRTQLEVYLQTIVQIPELVKYPPFRKFLLVDRAVESGDKIASTSGNSPQLQKFTPEYSDFPRTPQLKEYSPKIASTQNPGSPIVCTKGYYKIAENCFQPTKGYHPIQEVNQSSSPAVYAVVYGDPNFTLKGYYPLYSTLPLSEILYVEGYTMVNSSWVSAGYIPLSIGKSTMTVANSPQYDNMYPNTTNYTQQQQQHHQQHQQYQQQQQQAPAMQYQNYNQNQQYAAQYTSPVTQYYPTTSNGLY